MSGNYDGTTYAELIDVLESLPRLVRETRRRRQVSLREAAEQVGTSFSTISRLENDVPGRDRGISLGCAIKLLAWVGASDVTEPP